MAIVKEFFITLNYKGEIVKAYFDNIDTNYKIKYIWENFGELFLKGGKAAQQMARQHVATRPEFQQLMADPTQFLEAYHALVAEAGQDKTDKLLAILGVTKPEISIAAGAEQGGTVADS